MKEKLIASAFALLFAIPFGLVGLGAAYAMAAMVYDGVRAKEWVLVKADVTGAAAYRYTFQGKTYDGTRLGTMRIGGTTNVDDFDDRVGAMLAEGREKKKPITVFVNPDEPSEAMVDRAIRWGLLMFLTPFAVAFGGVGLGALWLVKRIFREEPKASGKKGRERNVGAEAVSSAASGAGGLWFFAIMWNAISFPIAALTIPDAVADGDYAVLFVLIFPLIGIAVLWAAISATFHQLRRGRAGAAGDLDEPRRST